MTLQDAPPVLAVVPAGDSRVDPSVESTDYLSMKSYWQMVDTILGGQQAMHEAGETYLPRLQEERVTKDSVGKQYDPYKLRLAKAPFTNIYEDITRNLASRPFSKTLTMKEGTPPKYEALAENIDAQGRSLHVFAAEVFQYAVDHAISWILVDYTRPVPRADGLPMTRLDEQTQKLRPYWCHIHATNLVAVYSEYQGGTEIITHARISEPSMTLDGYIEKPVERIRVLNREAISFDEAGKPVQWGPPTYKCWELVVGTSGQNIASTWQLVDEGVYQGVDVIPLVPVIVGQRVHGSWRVKPPLRNLAFMQIEEYQNESNLQNIIEMTCFPMLCGKGVADSAPGEPQIAIGPRMILLAPPPQAGGTPGEFTWIEPGAQSVQICIEKLNNIRTEMRDLGMQPLTQANLTVITTGQVAVKANSTVQAWTINLADALEQAWKLTAQWMGDPNLEPEVVVYKDFNVAIDQGQGFAAVQQMRANNDVSRETIITTAMRYGYLPDDFDLEQDAEQLAEEQQGLEPEVPIDPVTGQPIQLNLSTGQPPQPGQPPPQSPPSGRQPPPSPPSGRQPPPSPPRTNNSARQ